MNGSNYSFAYDTKGNVTNDGLRGITMNDYNHNNLPLVVSLSNHNYNYTYNDNGERIKKLARPLGGTNVDSLQTDYYLRDYLGIKIT